MSIIAVDFDMTLAVTEYPVILRPIPEVIAFCKKQKTLGDTLILHTCREGNELACALLWCYNQGLTFDYVNQNTAENIAQYGDCRKIYADFYLDDHNLLVSQIKEKAL